MRSDTATTAQASKTHAVAATGAHHVVETRGLTKRFGDLTALDGLDLAVPERSIVGFLGPNGAGKTTAMKLLVGLTRPSAGSAEVFGLDVAQRSTEVRARVGYLAQEPRFYEHLSARETLRFVARFFYAGPVSAIERRIDALLDLVGLTEKADRPIRGFSGGERQRLGIAQANVNEPDLLLMDEPAAALDPAGRQAVLAILARLRERTTVFFSTHILDDVQRVADRVAILDHGRLLAYAPTPELLAGDGATTFELAVRGPVDALRTALGAETWVDGIDRGDGDDEVLHVRVNDVDAAEAQLLRVALAVPGVIVRRFQPRSFELEEVFMRLVNDSRGQP
jgi:ABC-2 type transport system ATP-binding protein